MKMFPYRSFGNVCRLFRNVGVSTSRNYKSTASFNSIHSRTLISRNMFPSIARSNLRCYSTKESSLADFLKEEIEAEKSLGKQQLEGAKQPEIPGFQIKQDQREVVLSKKHGDETITVTFDVNHSVDTDAAGELPSGKAGEQSQDAPQMVSKPPFIVEIAKGDQKLAFECAFVEPQYKDEGGTEDYDDVFNIEEVYMFTGEMNEKNKIYAVSGGIVDGTLYDHFMNYLEERGIDDDFAHHLIRYATFYEHTQYVSLLQKLRDFVAK